MYRLHLTFALLLCFCVQTAPAAEAPKKTKYYEFLPGKVDAKKLGFDEIVFVKRMQYSSDHYYTDINNGTRGPRFLPENGIYIYNVKTGKERPVVTAAQMPGGKGFLGKMSLSFDAKKAIFDFRETPKSGFRIWEVNLDGTGLRQLTKEPAKNEYGGRVDDIHPCYLPDGSIIFSSTRSEHIVLCGGSNALVAPTLHKMDADGSNLRILSDGVLTEMCPLVMDDGRVMYHRWEYIDKGARVAKTIWSMNPDGSKVQHIYGLDDDTTTVYVYQQPVPGRKHTFVSAGSCHFPQGGCSGAIMLVDYGKDQLKRGADPDEEGYTKWDEKSAAINLTPHIFVERRTEPGWYFMQSDGKYKHDRNGTSGMLYTHPFPISDREFLVSCKTDPAAHYKDTANAYGLYLLDVDGKHQLVHRDPKLSCWHATPLVPRKTPPVLKPNHDQELAKKGQALCVVTNIYQGMEGVEPGEVKWIRVNEAVSRYRSSSRRWGNSFSSSGWKGALWPRVQWGVVPVEKDGSAQFYVPANRNIFFQALDEDFQEIQRERTFVTYKPGEVRSCTGCHGQSNLVTEGKTGTSIALTKKPSELQPQPCDLKENGGTGLAGQVIHYPTDIQPIFDAKCIKCHGCKKQEGGLNLSGELTKMFSTSYEMLGKKQLAGPILSEFTALVGGEQGNYNGAFLPPRSLGCPKSMLLAIMTDPAHPKNIEKKKETKSDHLGLLTPMELQRLRRWIDSNYQFYGTYYGRRHSHWATNDDTAKGYEAKRDFRRKATFEEATSNVAPEWHK